MKIVKPHPPLSPADSDRAGFGMPARTNDDKAWTDIAPQEATFLSRATARGIANDDHAVTKAFRQMVFEYRLWKKNDENGVAPKEAQRLADKMDRAVKDLRAVFDLRLLSPFVIEDLQLTDADTVLRRFSRAAEALRHAGRHSGQGAIKELDHERHVRLAGRVLEMAEFEGWDLAPNNDGLLSHWITGVLATERESHKRPDQLLKEAAQRRSLKSTETPVD